MSHVGRYELVRRLATGGMAEVFLARVAGPAGFEKQVVVKRILPSLSNDPRFVDLFLAEARISARLSHQNIVQIFDFGEADGGYYIAMEYVDGPSARALIKHFAHQQCAFPVDLATRIAMGACEALIYAHEFRDGADNIHSVIHRDVTPENIIVSRSGAVKLVDFGIAKAVSGAKEAHTTARRGKHSYMAPEQVRGKLALDGRLDLFALGVVFYELVTGVAPFRRPTELATLQAVLFEPAPAPSSLREGVPPLLDRICQRALMKDRDARYPDARELLADLERLLLKDLSRSVTGAELGALARSVETLPLLPPAASAGLEVADPTQPSHAALVTDPVTAAPKDDPDAAARLPSPRGRLSRLLWRDAPATEPLPVFESLPGRGPAGSMETRVAPAPGPSARKSNAGRKAPLPEAPEPRGRWAIGLGLAVLFLLAVATLRLVWS